MKKIIITSFAIAFAVCANAATTKWGIGTTGGKLIYTPGSTTVTLSGDYTAYVFCSATADTDTTATLYSQADVLAAARNGGISGLKYQFAADVSDAAIATQAFTSDDFASGKSVTMFFAIFDEANDRVFISGTSSKNSNVTTQQSFTINPQTASQGALNTGNWSAAGWYAATPEPTSGIMLLLGVGLMALKRKRA